MVSRHISVVQAAFSVGNYVSVHDEQGGIWYGQVKGQADDKYRVRVGGTDREVSVPSLAVGPHPSFPALHEERRDGDTVTTDGGKWTAVEYNSKMGKIDPKARGLHIKLEFTPNNTVDATRIVLVQTVTAIKNNDIYFLDESVKNRARFGVSIDQHGESASPDYVAKPTSSGGSFGSSPLDDKAGSHGYRFKLYEPEGWTVKSAWLTDNPTMRNVTSFSQQRFETTAIAAEGNDKGRYYGSVKWGWAWSPGRKVKLIPLEVVTQGYGASAQFKESAKQWNKTLTSKGASPIQLPLPKD